MKTKPIKKMPPEKELVPLYTDLRERGMMLWDVRDYLVFFSADETSQRYMLGISNYEALNERLQEYTQTLVSQLNHVNRCYADLKKRKLARGEFE